MNFLQVRSRILLRDVGGDKIRKRTERKKKGEGKRTKSKEMDMERTNPALRCVVYRNVKLPRYQLAFRSFYLPSSTSSILEDV